MEAKQNWSLVNSGDPHGEGFKNSTKTASSTSSVFFSELGNVKLHWLLRKWAIDNQKYSFIKNFVAILNGNIVSWTPCTRSEQYMHVSCSVFTHHLRCYCHVYPNTILCGMYILILLFSMQIAMQIPNVHTHTVIFNANSAYDTAK